LRSLKTRQPITTFLIYSLESSLTNTSSQKLHIWNYSLLYLIHVLSSHWCCWSRNILGYENPHWNAEFYSNIKKGKSINNSIMIIMYPSIRMYYWRAALLQNEIATQKNKLLIIKKPPVGLVSKSILIIKWIGVVLVYLSNHQQA